MGYFFESQSSTGTFYTCNHRRVVIEIPQNKATNVDPPNSGLGRKWAECIDKEPKRAKGEGGRGAAGVENPKCVLSSAEVLGSAETIR